MGAPTFVSSEFALDSKALIPRVSTDVISHLGLRLIVQYVMRDNRYIVSY